jgi:hypothetical protein
VAVANWGELFGRWFFFLSQRFLYFSFVQFLIFSFFFLSSFTLKTSLLCNVVFPLSFIFLLSGFKNNLLVSTRPHLFPLCFCFFLFLFVSANLPCFLLVLSSTSFFQFVHSSLYFRSPLFFLSIRPPYLAPLFRQYLSKK